jgi:4-aminobutyrate aminotransferase/(S)-3-amino-2-methylpropionate transaminase
MHNRQRGVGAMKIVSFEGGFHGRTLGALSATRSKPIHKLDFPAFDWPMVPFPASRFPLEAHAAENRAAEARSLEIVRDVLIREGGAVAGLIVEPIQGEGGDRHASPAFFRELRALCAEHEVAFVVDEVQTGVGATGRFWAHEAWELPEPPDIVTWSKKFQLGGIHLREELFDLDAFRLFGTFLGDPLRAAQFEIILRVIERDRLIERTRLAGARLVSGLTELCDRYPGRWSQARGQGTFAAVDAADPRLRDRLLDALRQSGVEAGGSGDRSIRFRPALVFGRRHVDEVLEKLDALGS